MSKVNPKVDGYFTAGCGLCRLFATPECKVHKWDAELAKLREIVLECGLDEELKWYHPVYTLQKKNIVMLGAFNDYAVLSFFKGVLLKDTNAILIKPTENIQAERVIRFTDVRKIIELESVIKDYIHEAVEVEKAGLKVEYKKTSDFAVAEEFQNKLDENPALKIAFESLTPGRQRGYLLHFSQPKQSKTRAARVEKFAAQIMIGKGLND